MVQLSEEDRAVKSYFSHRHHEHEHPGRYRLPNSPGGEFRLLGSREKTCAYCSYDDHFLPPEFFRISMLARVAPFSLESSFFQSLDVGESRGSIADSHDKMLRA